MTRRKARVPLLSDEEEARIQAGIAADPDNPEITDEQWVRMRPAHEVLPPALYAALTRGRTGDEGGAAAVKVAVTLSLDADVVAMLDASGAAWRDRVDDVLRAALPTLVGQD